MEGHLIHRDLHYLLVLAIEGHRRIFPSVILGVYDDYKGHCQKMYDSVEEKV